MSLSVSRRGLLAGAAGLAATASLSACGSGGGSSNGAAVSNAGELVLPTHVPFPGIEPALPAGAGIPAGFTTIQSPATEVGQVPLPQTGKLTALLQGNPPLVSPDKNRWLQQLTADCGAEFDVAWGSPAYLDKFQVTVAGGELPDVVMITDVPQLPKLLESKFTDLSEFLSGDKVKEYPGLASMPTGAWEVSVVNGGIWGVAKTRPTATGTVMLTRGDLLEAKGIEAAPQLSDGEDFLALLAELTDVRNGNFAMGADPTAWLMSILLEMMGAPNQWRAEGGKLVHAYETEQFKAALEQAVLIWEKQYIHPSSIAESQNNMVWWDAGTTALYIDGVAGWGSHARREPEWNVQGVTVPKWDGGGAATKHMTDGAYPSYAAIRKQDSPDRVREILRVMDYIAAPFGSREWLTVNYGVEGPHYEMKDGVPASTKLFSDELCSIGYLGSQLSSHLFVPGDLDMVTAQHDYCTAVTPTGEDSAVKGLYSEAESTKGATAAPKLADAQREIIQGRRPVSSWDQAVDVWRKTAGDQMRAEYEEGLANS